MTLLIVLILAAILIVIGITVIKKTAKAKLQGGSNTTQVNTTGSIPPSHNPGSIPDKNGTKGDGDSVLSSGKQG